MKSYLSKRNRKRQSRKTSKRHNKNGGGQKELRIDYKKERTLKDISHNKKNDIYNILVVGRIFRRKEEDENGTQSTYETGSQEEINDLVELGKIYISLLNEAKSSDSVRVYFGRNSGKGSDVFIKRIKDRNGDFSSISVPIVTKHRDTSDKGIINGQNVKPNL